MKLIFKALAKYKWAAALSIFLKLLGTLTELSLPYILEYIIDTLVPAGRLRPVMLWGSLMFVAAILTRFLNATANRRAVNTAHFVSYDIRNRLFRKTINLSGSRFDAFTLPSLISRMTSDSYNVQAATQQLQVLCVRSPILLIGGIIVTVTMDAGLATVLLAILPVLLTIILIVSAKGIPLFNKVQQYLDRVVRVMRENITGIRVVKALSKTEYEKRRFARANDELTAGDLKASTVMAIPGPFMQTCLNTGLAIIVLLGASRVNKGLIEPGVILAFLTYFNMIAMGVMGINRIFITMSKASASANRINKVLESEEDQPQLAEGETRAQQEEGFIAFENVSFAYGGAEETGAAANVDGSEIKADFAGEQRENALENITFHLKKGESLGIIGPTGCGKTTVINLLMRFYDVPEGGVFVDGKDVRTYKKEELRAKFGVCFQNDMVFQDTLRENVVFGREENEAKLRGSIEDAMAAEYIDALEDGLDYGAAIRGANLSGGQKQRLLIARALYGDPEILVLDDSSSALDYKTDAAVRKAIEAHHGDTTLIMVAQRVSSIMNLDRIMVMDNGRCIGLGTHEELMKTCPAYRETCEVQMGSLAS